jgi:hypothetical protein
MARVADVPVPPRMQALPKDPRGYPIPVIVSVTSDCKAHFQINDETKRQQVIAADRCSICGWRLNRLRYYVGGRLSAFHEHGAFIDPAMHKECAEYALQVCPYLAAPRYTRELGERALTQKQRQEIGVLVDPTAMPGRPADEEFVLVGCVGERLVHDYIGITRIVKYLRPKRPYRSIDIWRHGQHLRSMEKIPVEDGK